MADLRAVERRRNRLVGFPSFVPAKVKATNKRGPKAPGTSTEEIVYVVGTEEVGPLLEEEASRELKGKLSEEAKVGRVTERRVVGLLTLSLVPCFCLGTSVGSMQTRTKLKLACFIRASLSGVLSHGEKPCALQLLKRGSN